MANAKNNILLTSMLEKKTFVLKIEVGGIKERGVESAYDSITTKTVIPIKNLSSYSRLKQLTKENLSEAFFKLYGHKYKELEVLYIVH